MAQFLILTPAQASALRGPTLLGKALDPVALADGRFVLPLSTATDDHGASANAVLDALPSTNVAANLFPVAPE